MIIFQAKFLDLAGSDLFKVQGKLACKTGKGGNKETGEEGNEFSSITSHVSPSQAPDIPTRRFCSTIYPCPCCMTCSCCTLVQLVCKCHQAVACFAGKLALNFEEVRTSKIQEFGLKDDCIPKGMQVYCVVQTPDEDTVVVLLAQTRCQVEQVCRALYMPVCDVQ